MRDNMGFVELQPWITLKSEAGTAITQPRSGWVQAGAYDHASLDIHIRDSTGTVTVAVQSAIIDEDEYFQQMSGASAQSRTINHISVPNTATSPLLRYVRWVVTGNAGWECTFRILGLFKQT